MESRLVVVLFVCFALTKYGFGVQGTIFQTFDSVYNVDYFTDAKYLCVVHYN